MADDIYSALIGNPQNDDAAKLAALAKSLRGQSNMGLVAQVSGDSVLSPIGKQMMDTSNKQAEDYGGRAEQARYRGYQEKQGADSLAQRKIEEENQQKYRMAEIAARAEDRALTRALAAEKGKSYRQLTAAQQKELDALNNSVSDMGGVIGGFKPEYAGTGVPGGRSVANWAAAQMPGLASDADKNAQKWWSDYRRIYELGTRKELFGSTLTPAEQKSWAEANITENMNPEQIQKALGTIEGIRQAHLDRAQRRLVTLGYDPEQVSGLFDSAGQPTEEAQPSAAADAVIPSFEEWKAQRNRK